jgi:hypothetical protein
MSGCLARVRVMTVSMALSYSNKLTVRNLVNGEVCENVMPGTLAMLGRCRNDRRAFDDGRL